MDTAALLQAIYKAFRENRIAEMTAYLGDDFRYIVHLPDWALPGGDKPRDKTETAETIAYLGATYDLVSYDPGPIIATDHTATVQPVIRIREKRTGKELEIKLAHTWRVRDGKVIELDERHDVGKVEAFLRSVSEPGA